MNFRLLSGMYALVRGVVYMAMGTGFILGMAADTGGMMAGMFFSIGSVVLVFAASGIFGRYWWATRIGVLAFGMDLFATTVLVVTIGNPLQAAWVPATALALGMVVFADLSDDEDEETDLSEDENVHQMLPSR